MKILFYLFIFISVVFFTNAQTAAWGEMISGSDADAPSVVVTDSSGNVYVAGNFWSDTLYFNNNKKLIRVGTVDAFLAKYNSSGVCQWVTSLSGASQQTIADLAVDKNGNIYITGNFNSNILTFNNNKTLNNYLSSDSYLAKYNNNGMCQWASKIYGDFYDFSYRIKLDDYDNIYIGGNFNSNTINFDNGISLNNSSQFECFIAKYYSNGVCQWAQSFQGLVDDIFNDMVTDGNGNIYVIGNFRSEELIFNNDIKLINSNIDIFDTFITKYNANGTCQWAKQIIGNMDSYSGTINIDSLNNIYISGVFTSDTVFFNNNIYTIGNSNNYNIYLSKYNSNGDCQWANPIIGNSMVNSPKSLVIDNNGFVNFAGVFDSPTLDFNNNFSIQHSGNQDIFLARYDSSGSCLNAQKIGDSGFDEVSNLFINENNEMFMTGYSESDSLDFANNVIVKRGVGLWGFFAKYQVPNNSVILPQITTNSITEISKTSAKSGGTFSVQGNQAILQKGVCWSLNQNPTLADDFTNDGTDSTDYLSQLTKLNQNSNYYIRAYVVIANDTIYGDEKNFQTPQAIYPSLVTKIPYQITKNTATSGGSFASQGDIDIIRKGVCWSVSINPTLFDFSTNDGDDSTDFFSNLTNLTPQTEYYVRAYVIIDGDTIYGTNTNFTTLNKVKPTLTTIAPSQITKYSASSGATFNIQGDYQVLQKGVCWSVNQNPTVNDNLSNEGSDSTNFVSNIINLTPQTDYYVRAYVIIQGDTIYGTQQSFTTDNYTPPQLTTISISNIKLSSAESGGQFTVVGDLPILSKGVCWSNDILPTINDNYTTDGSGPDDFESIVSVDPNCSSKYYVRAYATTNNGIFYGDTVSFLSSSSNISFYPDKLNRFYSDSTVQIFEIALDNNNDLIIYGQANGKDSVYLNNKSMDINDKTDFIAKIDTNGWVKWIKKIDKVSININEGDTYPIIKVDKNNNIIVSCNFSDFQISCFNCYRSVGYLVKYESNGNKLWDRFINGIPIYYAGCETPICDVEVDSQANIYVVGTGFTDSLLVSNYINYDLDPATAINYLIKYDSSGTVNWVKIDTSVSNHRINFERKFTKNSLDSLFLASRYQELIIINGISKFNGDTLSNYEITFDWNSDFELYDFEVDKRDNFYITGLYSKIIKFGLSDSLENNLSDNVNFIAKIDNNFNFLWAKNTTRLEQYSVNDYFNCRISFDKNNNVYLVGNVDSISFNLNSCSNFKFNHKFDWLYDGYIMKVTPEGQIDLFSQITGNSKTSMNGIRYLNNSLYVCGTVLSDTTDFLSGVELIKNKSSNGFLARYLIVSPNNNSQNIYLSQGWNLISSNLYISNANLDTIYKDISNNIVISKNNSGDVFIPSYNINTIGNWDLTQGYNVYANNSDTLKLTGILVDPSNRPIQLKAGWNTISYLRSSEMSAINAFTSITDNNNLLIAKTLDGKVYIPSYSINTIGNLKQGVGYKVYVTNADTLVYPGN